MESGGLADCGRIHFDEMSNKVIRVNGCNLIST